MDLDTQLFILCEDFVENLQMLKDDGKITMDEFESMAKYKLEFIADYQAKVCLQA